MVGWRVNDIVAYDTMQERLTALNAAYRERFGFPFIVAVRGHTRQSIIDAMAERLQHAREAEIAEALRQIGRIAAWRLADLIG